MDVAKGLDEGIRDWLSGHPKRPRPKSDDLTFLRNLAGDSNKPAQSYTDNSLRRIEEKLEAFHFYRDGARSSDRLIRFIGRYSESNVAIHLKNGLITHIDANLYPVPSTLAVATSPDIKAADYFMATLKAEERLASMLLEDQSDSAFKKAFWNDPAVATRALSNGIPEEKLRRWQRGE